MNNLTSILAIALSIIGFTNRAAHGQAAVEKMISSGSASHAPSKPVVPAAIVSGIKDRAKASHPADFQTQIYVIEKQSADYLKLATLSKPDDIPQEAYDLIRNTCRASHPSDYSTELYVARKELEAFRKLATFSWPSDVPESTMRSIVMNAWNSHRTNYSTQLYVITRQIDAYHQLSAATP